ncbi:MAG: hypothetical protein SF052_01340 [Bacteroidia bacterium]|nr:hypothetical protein [Bacteroidia bacterium]
MNRCSLVVLLLLPFCIYAQPKTDLGVNLAALMMGTGDVRADIHLTPGVALQLGAGVRNQNRNSEGKAPSFQALGDFIQQKNRAAYFSVGSRLTNPQEDVYEYPYMGFHLTGVWYQENLLPEDPLNGNPAVVHSTSGFKLGISTTIGFSLRLTSTLYADLAVQMGYSKPREDLLAYYLPGLGYSTFGYGYIGVKGGHLQPVITLRYTIIKDRRMRIREME